MPVPKPSDQELIAASQDILRTVGGLTNFAEGSAGGAFVAAYVENKRMGLALLEQAEAARDIELARGTDLDNLGRSFGIQRLAPTRAGSDSNAAQVLFRNNGMASVSVPTGTGVFSSADVSTRFYTTSSLSLAAGATGLVGVQGPSGEYHDVAQGALNAHNGDARLSVTNVLPVRGGSGYETDEELRYRISTTITGAVLGGPTSAQSIRAALEAQPGVAQAILVNPRPGELVATIVTTTGYLPDDDLLTSLQEVMATKAAAGITVRAQAPRTVAVDVDVALSIAGGGSASVLRSQIVAVSEAYINTRQAYVFPQDGEALLSPAASIYDAAVIYADLQAAIVDTVRATLGNSLQGVAVLLSTGTGQRALQGDVYPRNGEVLRARATRVTVTAV